MDADPMTPRMKTEHNPNQTHSLFNEDVGVKKGGEGAAVVKPQSCDHRICSSPLSLLLPSSTSAGRRIAVAVIVRGVCCCRRHQLVPKPPSQI
ncbi:hypothetical protein Nepgr_011678 [Nepenthes gracilis]|uniref:Uncharacterized protein n=1 Tax=Nepenthes gracilis TaxID=150966 RepID=A0AAD3XM64_NEPGR|nr:hypothetical protein Nepgr_011678 [Nepenthes gracilis]